MNKDFAIVSALFNIEREGMDGRAWEDYLEWFNKTLKLRVPMILFVTQDLEHYIKERRLKEFGAEEDLPTEIIVQTTDDIPYYHLKDQLDNIIASEQYRERIADPGRIECRHSMYSIIQYSKFKWLTAAADSNPFESKFFFWLDAGGSRFFDDYDITHDYPSPNAMESFEAMGDQFLVQMNMEYYPDLAEASILPKSYLLNNRSYVLGSMFGGGINSVKKVADDIEDVFINEMIGNDYVNNEQIALGYLIKKNPDDYAIYERTNHKHAAIFEELGKR